MCSSYCNKTQLHTRTHTHTHTHARELLQSRVYRYLKNCSLNAILFISCIFRFVIITVLCSPSIINEYVDRPHFASHYSHYKQRLSRFRCIGCKLERNCAQCNMCRADPPHSPLKAISHFICYLLLWRVLMICYPLFSAA